MAHRVLHRLRTVLLIGAAGLAAVAAIVLAGGQAAVVVTHGVSMNPLYHQGDLVVIARASSYAVGQIAAYKLPDKKEVALHRIIGRDGDAFVFKGDNNQSVDPLTPRGDELVGRAVLHIPQGGLWLETLTSPPVLGLLAFALLAGGGAATRRRRRKRRRAEVSRHISTSPALPLALGALPLPLRVSVALGAVLAVLGVGVGMPAWLGPLQEEATSPVKSDTRVDFSYTADVGRSAAYDGTTANSPDPVFRKLTDTVDVHFSYSGEPGTVSVTADLSAPGGWHSTVLLDGPQTFTGGRYEGTVRLDLKSFDAKAQAASAVTGLPAGPLAITLTPHIQTTAGGEFRPGLKLNLTALQLSLTGSAKDLTVTATTTTGQVLTAERMIGMNGVDISAATARLISATLLLVALGIGVIVVVLGRRSTPVDEGTAIRRRYAALLVRVQPVPAPQGRPVIDVTTFATLAKLAERYGLLVLHWTRSGVETFVVQDESITYRYRTGAQLETSDLESSVVHAGV